MPVVFGGSWNQLILIYAQSQFPAEWQKSSNGQIVTYQIASHEPPYIQQIELSGDDGILNFWNTRQSKIAVVVNKHRLHLGGVGIELAS